MGSRMASPEPPDETVGASTAPADGPPDARAAVTLPAARLPVYRPRSRAVGWSFLCAFVIAAAASALVGWLLLR